MIKLLVLMMLFPPAHSIIVWWTVNATGRLTCNHKDLSHTPPVLMELYDYNIRKDDLMASYAPKADGYFMLSGRDAALPLLQPFIYIHHRCNYNNKCTKMKVYVRNNYRCKRDYCFHMDPLEITEAFNHGESDSCTPHPADHG